MDLRTQGLINALQEGGPNLGQTMIENANQQQQFQSQAPLRAAQAQHAQGQADELQQRVQRESLDNAARQSPQAAAALRSLLGKYGTTAPDGTPAATLEHILPIAEKGYTADQNREARRESARILTGGRLGAAQINQGLQPTAQGAGEGGAPAGPAPLGGKMLQKRLDELNKDMQASGGRAGEFGKNQARVGAANRVLTLALDENGQPRNLTPQQMPELAQAVASLISNGGTGAQAQIEHLTPHTITGDINAKIQYLMNAPRGAGQQSFVANMAELAKREQTVAQQALNQKRTQDFGKHMLLFRSNPNEAGAVLKQYGFTIGPDGMPSLADQPAPQAAPAQDNAALRKKYGL